MKNKLLYASEAKEYDPIIIIAEQMKKHIFKGDLLFIPNAISF